MTPQQQFDAFLAKYTPALVKTANAMIRKIRKAIPGAVEIVYDNWNGLVIGFGPTEKPSDAIVSLLMLPTYVDLFFLDGARLDDPHEILEGSGNKVRHIKLHDPKELDAPEIQDMLQRAVARSGKPVTGPRKLVIKSVSPKQRPRRPTPAAQERPASESRRRSRPSRSSRP